MAKCTAIYTASMTALTKGHNDIQRDALIEGNAQRRRMDALLQYWDDLAQALEDYQDCLDEQESEEDEESENQD